MRLIDANRLLSEDMKTKYYHLPNGDIAIPIIDIDHAPTVDAVPLDKLCALLAENADCPPEHSPVQDHCKANCAECWESVLQEWMKEYDCENRERKHRQ